LQGGAQMGAWGLSAPPHFNHWGVKFTGGETAIFDRNGRLSRKRYDIVPYQFLKAYQHETLCSGGLRIRKSSVVLDLELCSGSTFTRTYSLLCVVCVHWFHDVAAASTLSRAFPVASQTFWNSLPEELRPYSSDSFKAALKTFLFARY